MIDVKINFCLGVTGMEMKGNPSETPPAPIHLDTEGLGEVERRVLSYAASMGKEFDFAVLAKALEMTEEALAEILERLVQSGILKELKAGDSYAFVRGETLTQTYGEISSSRLRVIHGKIAEAYEKLHPDPAPGIIPEMGRQFHLAQVHDKSLVYNRYAAAQATAAFSPDVAIHYLERAREDLAALPGNHRVEEAEVLKEIGAQYEATGEDALADKFYEESLMKLPEDEVTMRALLLLSRADAARKMDKLGLTRQYCEEAIRLLEKVGHKKGLALAHRGLSRAAYREGQLEAGMKEIETTIGLLDPVKDAKEVASCYIDLGNIRSGLDAPEEQMRSIDSYRKAIQILEPLHDFRELSRAHNNLAITLMPAHPEEAMKEIKMARAYAEKTKDRRSLGWRLFNGVEMHLALGSVEEAIRDNEEAGKILSLLNDPFGIEQVTLNEGIIAQYRKSYEESERAYVEALKLAEKLGYPQVLVETLVHFASMHVEWGKRQEAADEISRIQKLGEANVYATLKALYEKLKKQVDNPSS
jgi:tetratricopeptide (TPR) repeat protein